MRPPYTNNRKRFPPCCKPVHTLTRSRIEQLAPQLSRLRPVIFYWIFITADIICITLQASGGALSTVSVGTSETGVKIALAGLAAQLIFLFCFCVCFCDYMIRYFQSSTTPPMTRKLRTCFAFLALAVVCILGRCCYRCYELSQGYRDSTVITDEGLFIGLEGVYVSGIDFNCAIIC